jgi:uncharacterized membrane protein YfcA
LGDPLVQQLVLFAIALVANTFSALAGGGAGLIQFPALIFLGLPFPLALATHKVATVALGVGATTRHLREKALDLRFALYILACGVPGVVLGSVIAVAIPARLGEIALGLLTLGLGLYSMLSPALGQVAEPRHRDRAGHLVGGIALLFLGVMNGALTSGTGLFVTMLLVRWFGLDYKRAIAYTLVLVGLVWNGSGALTMTMIAEVKWSWVPALLAGSVLGGYAGTHLAIVKGNRFIKRAFEIVSILIGVKLLMP